MTITQKQTTKLNKWDFDTIHIWEKLLTTDMIKNNTREMTLDLAIAYAYRYDFTRLLNNELGINPDAWYIHMRVNGLESPVEYTGTPVIKVIDPNVIESIMKKIKAGE